MSCGWVPPRPQAEPQGLLWHHTAPFPKVAHSSLPSQGSPSPQAPSQYRAHTALPTPSGELLDTTQESPHPPPTHMVRGRKVWNDSPGHDNRFPSSDGLAPHGRGLFSFLALVAQGSDSSSWPAGQGLLGSGARTSWGPGHAWGWFPCALPFNVNTRAEGQALLGRKGNISA